MVLLKITLLPRRMCPLLDSHFSFVLISILYWMHMSFLLTSLAAQLVVQPLLQQPTSHRCSHRASSHDVHFRSGFLPFCPSGFTIAEELRWPHAGRGFSNLPVTQINLCVLLPPSGHIVFGPCPNPLSPLHSCSSLMTF